MNSSYMNSSPSLNSRHLISRSSVDQIVIASANNAVEAETANSSNPVRVASVNGKIVDQNGNHGNRLDDDDVFGENGRVPHEEQKSEKKKKRSVSESDKEVLEERHYGPTRKHSSLTVCLSAPLEKVEEVGDTNV